MANAGVIDASDVASYGVTQAFDRAYASVEKIWDLRKPMRWTRRLEFQTGDVKILMRLQV